MQCECFLVEVPSPFVMLSVLLQCKLTISPQFKVFGGVNGIAPPADY